MLARFSISDLLSEGIYPERKPRDTTPLTRRDESKNYLRAAVACKPTHDCLGWGDLTSLADEHIDVVD